MSVSRSIGTVRIELVGKSHDQMRDVVEWLSGQLDDLHRQGVLMSGVEDNFGKGVTVTAITGTTIVEV